MTLQCIQQPHQHLQANLENGVLTLALNRAEAKMHFMANYIFGWQKRSMMLMHRLRFEWLCYVVLMQIFRLAMT